MENKKGLIRELFVFLSSEIFPKIEPITTEIMKVDRKVARLNNKDIEAINVVIDYFDPLKSNVKRTQILIGFEYANYFRFFKDILYKDIERKKSRYDKEFAYETFEALKLKIKKIEIEDIKYLLEFSIYVVSPDDEEIIKTTLYNVLISTYWLKDVLKKLDKNKLSYAQCNKTMDEIVTIAENYKYIFNINEFKDTEVNTIWKKMQYNYQYMEGMYNKLVTKCFTPQFFEEHTLPEMEKSVKREKKKFSPLKFPKDIPEPLPSYIYYKNTHYDSKSVSCKDRKTKKTPTLPSKKELQKKLKGRNTYNKNKEQLCRMAGLEKKSYPKL